MLEIGREDADLVVADPAVSRRHARLEALPDGLAVTDLGSSNGTQVNGVRISGTVRLQPGDVVLVGATEIHVLADSSDNGSVAAGPSGAGIGEPGDDDTDAAPVAARAGLADLARRENEAAIVRFRPGSAGEAAAPDVLAAAKRSRRRLAGLGSEPWGRRPQLCLVDPFPDPDRPRDAGHGGHRRRRRPGRDLDGRHRRGPGRAPRAAAGPALRRRAARRRRARPCCSRATASGVAETPAADDAAAGPGPAPARGRRGRAAPAMALSFVQLPDRTRGRGGPPPAARRGARPAGSTPPPRRSTAPAWRALEEAWRRSARRGAADVEARASSCASRCATCARTRRRRSRSSSTCSSAWRSRWCSRSCSGACFDTALPSGEFSQVLELLGAARRRVPGHRCWPACAGPTSPPYVSGAVVRDLRREMFEPPADAADRLVRPPPAGRRPGPAVHRRRSLESGHLRDAARGPVPDAVAGRVVGRAAHA